LIVKITKKTPLIIDPSTVASEWIKTNLKNSNIGFEVINQQDSKFITQL